MAGRKPDYRLVVADDNGKGRVTYFRLGAAWLNENKETGQKSIGIQVNVGVPIVLEPNAKLILFENTPKNGDEEDADFGPAQ